MSGELASSAIKTAGALFLILGLILCFFYVLRKLRFGPAHTSGLSRMRLLSTLTLAPKRAVALVEIRDQWLVVGVGTEAVTLLTRMERPEETSRTEMPESRNRPSFRSMLQSRTNGTPSDER